MLWESKNAAETADASDTRRSYWKKEYISGIKAKNTKSFLKRFMKKWKYCSASQLWDNEKAELNAEISSQNMQIKAYEEQISDLTAELQEKAAKSNGFKGLFGK